MALFRDYTRFALARQLNDEYRCRLVMGDKLPRRLKNVVSVFFAVISRLRLGILTEQGEGSEYACSFFCLPLFVYLFIYLFIYIPSDLTLERVT